MISGECLVYNYFEAEFISAFLFLVDLLLWNKMYVFILISKNFMQKRCVNVLCVLTFRLMNGIIYDVYIVKNANYIKSLEKEGHYGPFE